MIIFWKKEKGSYSLALSLSLSLSHSRALQTRSIQDGGAPLHRRAAPNKQAQIKLLPGFAKNFPHSGRRHERPSPPLRLISPVPTAGVPASPFSSGPGWFSPSGDGETAAAPPRSRSPVVLVGCRRFGCSVGPLWWSVPGRAWLEAGRGCVIPVAFSEPLLALLGIFKICCCGFCQHCSNW